MSDEGMKFMLEREAEAKRDRQAEEFKALDPRELVRMSDKALAEWQVQFTADQPQYVLAEHEWQRRIRPPHSPAPVPISDRSGAAGEKAIS